MFDYEPELNASFLVNVKQNNVIGLSADDSDVKSFLR